MGIQDYIALAIALAAVVFVLKFTWRSFSGGGCACDPGDKPTGRSCGKAPVRSGIKQTPMVLIDEIGVIKPDTEAPSKNV
ncbi:MAG: hypothetical protein ACE5E5_00010 [Phycisphaerae bacterium]